jgi:hypothetical protein
MVGALAVGITGLLGLILGLLVIYYGPGSRR